MRENQAAAATHAILRQPLASVFTLMGTPPSMYGLSFPVFSSFFMSSTGAYTPGMAQLASAALHTSTLGAVK